MRVLTGKACAGGADLSYERLPPPSMSEYRQDVILGQPVQRRVVDRPRVNWLGLLQRQEKDGNAPDPSGGSAAAEAPASKGGEENEKAKEPKLLLTYA